MDLRTTTVVDLVAQLEAGELSARELTQHALDRIEALNPTLNAFVAVDAEGALAAAQVIDGRRARGEAVGALAGIPIGVKDLEDATGFVTTFGSALHVDDAVATQDSTQVARLRASGCIVVGKTNTPEHGWTSETTNASFGPSRNPWAPARSPGGSSGGTAAALAAGMVPLATGSDGGGSIRIPAALCGLSGFKPSPGRVPNGGHRAPGSGLLGVKAPMAQHVRDVAYALDVAVGPDPLDPFSLPAPSSAWSAQLAAVGEVPAPTRVLWAPTMGFEVDAEVLATCRAAIDVLEGLGTEIVEIDSPFSQDPLLTFLTMWSIMQWRLLGEHDGTPAWDQIDPGLREQLAFARDHLGPGAFAHALDDCYRYSAELETAFGQAPILLAPTVAGQTPFSGKSGTVDGVESLVWVRFTYPFNMTRHPAGSVNAGFTADGMPVGLQVVGRHRADVEVLTAMACLEDALAIERRSPV